MISNKKGLSMEILTLKMIIASALMLIWAAGCTSAPSEAPEKFVMDFLQKHIPMIDPSVAEYYVKEERAGIIAQVQAYITSKKEKGIFKSISDATYDFSKIKVEVLEQKEEYIDDEGVNFLKIAATGNYSKTMNGKTESFIEDEIIIIESVVGTWKVTEKINPWM
jgi:hypothetical protein